MKITKILLSSDSNLFYLGCWPIAVQVWKKAFGIDPILIYVSDIMNERLQNIGNVIHLKPVDNIDIGIQAKIARMYMASCYPLDTILLGDIDIVPINVDKLKRCIEKESDCLITYGGNAYDDTEDMGKFPMSLLTGTGEIFKKIVNPNSLSYTELLKTWSDIKDPIDNKESVNKPFKQFSDESLLRYLITKGNQDIRIIDVPRPLYGVDKIPRNEKGLLSFMPVYADRVDRMNDDRIVIIDRDIEFNKHSDIHLCRPIEKHINKYINIFKLMDINLVFPYYLLKMDYVTGNGFKALSDHILDEKIFFGREFKPENVKENDILFIKTDVLEYFFEHLFYKIKNPIRIITHNSDLPSPGKFKTFLSSPKIKKWYGQNCDIETSDPLYNKFIPIPIGFANIRQRDTGEFVPYSNQWIIEEYAKDSRNLEMKDFGINRPKVYMNFHLKYNENGERENVERILKHKPFIYEQSKIIPFNEYLMYMRECAFVACPIGNGLDCHRTWETLAMGCIPIVKRDTLTPLYEKLPVMIVDEWEDITQELLKKNLNKYKNYNIKENPKLFMYYWKKLIQNSDS